MRAVLDPNVIMSGLLSPSGAPAQVLRLWGSGDFELVVSPGLLEELSRARTYPKLRSRMSESDAEAVGRWLSESAATVRDPGIPTTARSADPGDDYLIALAASERAILVSGDKHLLGLAGQIPVYSPSLFLALLAGQSTGTPFP
jgi:uncharacterized protein